MGYISYFYMDTLIRMYVLSGFFVQKFNKDEPAGIFSELMDKNVLYIYNYYELSDFEILVAIFISFLNHSFPYLLIKASSTNL